MTEVKLPSGAILRITASPFSQAKALYQAVLKELKGVKISSKDELYALYKDLFCAGFSSPEVESCLWECMKRCTYNSGTGDLKIDSDTFEPVKAREDYMKVCVEVAKENIGPFVKSLYAEFQQALAVMEKSQA